MVKWNIYTHNRHIHTHIYATEKGFKKREKIEVDSKMKIYGADSLVELFEIYTYFSSEINCADHLDKPVAMN